MKAIVVTDQAAGTAGMKLVERPEPQQGVAPQPIGRELWRCRCAGSCVGIHRG
jgi:hypothetical protein